TQRLIAREPEVHAGNLIVRRNLAGRLMAWLAQGFGMFGLLLRSTFGNGKQIASLYTPPPAVYAAPTGGLSGNPKRRKSYSRCPSRKNSRRRSSMSCVFTWAAV